MDKLDRFQKLHRIFSSHKRPVALAKIAAELEGCTEKTAKRLIDAMRDYWELPLEYSKDAKGWYYNLKQGEKLEIPGIWLTANELQTLVALLHIVQSMDAGLVSGELSIIEKRVKKLLSARGVNTESFAHSIKYLPMAKRSTQNKHFIRIAEATLTHKQIELSYKDYWGRKSARTISPQNLIYYRENWHVDAWCHLRKELRTFSIARMDKVQLLKTKAKKIDVTALEEHFASSYGIFAGKAKYSARLLFINDAARDVASQQWHPQQKGEWQGKEYLLEIPYNNETELVMDILKYGNNVQVLGPSKLKQQVIAKLKGALSLYK